MTHLRKAIPTVGLIWLAAACAPADSADGAAAEADASAEPAAE